MLYQRLEQKLQQKLSPQQIQLMKLLQVPAVALEQRIKQEIEENPALEDMAEDADDMQDFQDDDTDSDFEEGQETDTDFEENVENDFSLDDYMDDDDTPEYKLNAKNTSADDEDREMPFASQSSFYEQLYEQLQMRPLSEQDYRVGEYIIGNIDENGYLKRDSYSLSNDLAFGLNLMVEADKVEEIIAVIQEFDPPGVGARDLRECLILQLARKGLKTNAVQNGIQILEESFDEFSKKHYDKIMRKMSISEAELKEAIDEIIKLNPKPGNSAGDSAKGSLHVFPDFTILNNEGELELLINSKNMPELRVSRYYQNMLEAYVKSKTQDAKTKEAIQFVRQKIDSAKWFIDALRQRQNTLYVTMSAIMEFQREYFLTGDDTKLKPMILKDIADRVMLDISTISRVASSKYVQTPFGTLLLKSFFSESMQTDSGEEVSSREIKAILTEVIGAEDKRKPLTDDRLAKILKIRGYNIARRTVAKYREQLDIPVARLRKEI
ncbi:MAG: RNA polymerase sigma-54 factor [Bacteroidetes bacterium HGW-Bacteroidetes-6]|jgi:RNA polymerase sigma-54 factor|nr:MAG: RNA polymerase sigma-54 factor [Bacteroidetes bacterium HGW-Bacteroidetes-6]